MTPKNSVTQHEFKKTYFSKPTFCLFCGKFIWGVTKKQGLECQKCHAKIHKKCELAATKAVSTFRCDPEHLAVAPRERSGSTVSLAGKKSGLFVDPGRDVGAGRLPETREELFAAANKLQDADSKAHLFEEAIANSTDFANDTDVRKRAILVLIQAERFHEASLHASELVARDFQDPEGYVLRAEVCVAAGDTAGARSSLKIAMTLRPDHPRGMLLQREVDGPKEADHPHHHEEENSGENSDSLPHSHTKSCGVGTAFEKLQDRPGGFTWADLCASMQEEGVDPGSFDAVRVLLDLDPPAFQGVDPSALVIPPMKAKQLVDWMVPLVQTFQALDSTGDKPYEAKNAVLSWLLTDVASYSHFHGFLSSRDSAILLARLPIGAFLTRFSGSPGYLTMSAKVGHNKVEHDRISLRWSEQNPPTVQLDLGVRDELFDSPSALADIFFFGQRESIFPSCEDIRLTETVPRSVLFEEDKGSQIRHAVDKKRVRVFFDNSFQNEESLPQDQATREQILEGYTDVFVGAGIGMLDKILEVDEDRLAALNFPPEHRGAILARIAEIRGGDSAGTWAALTTDGTPPAADHRAHADNYGTISISVSGPSTHGPEGE